MILLEPFEDFLLAVETAFAKASIGNFVVLIVCAVLSWWVYVPVHELGHAFGCLLSGGTVSKLEISPEYGAAMLKEVFPFVSVGSEYAGQLTGFDTQGSDLIYFATDFFPFLLTIFLGIPLLKSAKGSPPMAASVKLGVSLPLAFASFISMSGDYYEMGSILVSRIANTISPFSDLTRWRSDDVFKLADQLFFTETPFDAIDIFVVSFSFLTGIVLIYLTYMLGSLWTRVIVSVNKRFSN